MKSKTKRDALPWAFLDEFRGDSPGGADKPAFSGEWPTLPEMFRISAYRHGRRPCLTVYDPGRISLTYVEALGKIRAVARALRAAGIQNGDRVAVSGKNSPEWAVAYLGVLFANAVVVPVDYQIRAAETELLLNTARARALFIDEEKHDYFTRRPPAGLEHVYSLKAGAGTYVYDLDGPDWADADPAGEESLAAILFTSGTTGAPKGVMLTHKNLSADCYLAQATPLDVLHTDVFYAVLPIHHAYTMLAVFIETISQGAEVVFGKKMAVQNMLRDLREAKITMLLGVPMLFNKLLAGILRGLRAKGPFVYAPVRLLMLVSGLVKKLAGVNPGKALFGAILAKASLSTVRICICGGGPLSPAVFRKFNQLGLDFVQGYGLTETSPIINLNPVEHYKEKSVGKTVPGVDMKILDADERGVGEVALKGPMVMRGYFEMPEETAACFTADGYFRTGDLGYLDGENYLYLTGRAKNMIVTEGGKNVYPEEIENEFQLFDEIEQILIRGVVLDKKTRGEHIEALVYPSPEFFASAAAGAVEKRINAVVSDVNTRLLPYQKIEKVTILDAPLEMTTTKKIKR